MKNFLLIFFFISLSAFGPFAIRTDNPLLLQFIATPLETATVPEPHQFTSSILYSYSNLFEYHPQFTGVGIDFDMELHRAAIENRWGPTKNYQVGFEASATGFFGGFLDGFVQGYHNAFGFPNGGRNVVNNGRMNFTLTKNGAPIYNVTKRGWRLGDLNLFHKYAVLRETKKRPALAIKQIIKLPTGSASLGGGSGRVDTALSLLAEKGIKRFRFYTEASGLYVGGHRDLNEYVRHLGMSGNIAMEYSFNPYLSGLIQFDAMSSIFKNVDIGELKDIAGDFTVGFAGKTHSFNSIGPITYQTGFTEDILAVGPSVDFTLFVKAGVSY